MIAKESHSIEWIIKLRERIGKKLDLKNMGKVIQDKRFTKLNKLKKTDPEEFFYWYKALHLYPVT